MLLRQTISSQDEIDVRIGKLSVRLVPGSIALGDLLWPGIEATHGSGHLTSSWVWTKTWLRNYGDIIPHWFAIAETDHPVGIMLISEGFGQRIGPISVRTLHIGTAGEPASETVRVQYNNVMIAPEHRRAFMQGAIALMDRLAPRRDEIRFDGFPPAEIEDLIGHETEMRQHRIVSYVADLAGIRAAGKTFVGGLGGDRAKRIRRSIRLIEDRDGPITTEWADDLEQAQAIFDEMCALHQARWQAIGEPGVFSSQRFAAFHRELIEATFANGGVALVRVSAGGRTLGCDYSLIQHNRLLGYQWGLSQYVDHRVSIGTVTAASVMQAALERGFDEYDHLSGDTLYKKQLSTTSRELVWATVSLGVRANAIYKLAETKRRAAQIRASIPPIGELIASR
jgi:hypothetical protein